VNEEQKRAGQVTHHRGGKEAFSIRTPIFSPLNPTLYTQHTKTEPCLRNLKS